MTSWPKAHTAAVSHTVSSVDGTYNGMNVSAVTVNITDNDTAGFTISAISGNTTEAGATATFTAVLTSQPTADVTFGITSNDTSEGTVSPASLTFTDANWNTPQTVTVTGVNDFLDDGDIAYSIVNAAATSADGTYNTLNPSDVNVSNTDNDTAGITISAISGNVAESGTTATYTANLSSQPTADVTFGITSSDTSEGTVSPSSLTFTSGNWNTPQTVTVTGVDDFLSDGTVAFNIINAAASSADSGYNNLNPADLSVSCTDDDTASVVLTQSGGNTSVAEGGVTDSFTLELTTQPSDDVTVTFTGSAQISLSAPTMTFTSGNWNTPQTLTVSAVNDAIAEGTHGTTIAFAINSNDSSYNGFVLSDVSVSITDNDTAGFTVSAASGNGSEAGSTATYTVSLTSEPTASVTFSIASSNASVGTVSPSSLTFTNATWNTPQTVTITGVDNSIVDGTVAFSIVNAAATSADSFYNNLNPSDVSLSRTDNDEAESEGGGSSEGTVRSGGSGSSGSTPQSDEEIQNSLDEWEAEIQEDHWSESYIKDLLTEPYVIEIAIHTNLTLAVIRDFLLTPDLTLHRGDAIIFLLTQRGVDISQVTVDTGRLSFSDVNEDNMRVAYIEYAADQGLVDGYPDGTFKPLRSLNRAEALKLVFTFYDAEVETDLFGDELLAHYHLTSNPFSDVDLNQWYAPYVLYAYDQGIIVGYGDGTYKPDRLISHAELLKIASLSVEQ
ncbi:S-layer homology domain-containing protein [Candidatus Peregrinibacteria bacterium]|nr:MAG: S-layer homology domain-containing protein [Candidatus Peregrinibacteria bacterium]